MASKIKVSYLGQCFPVSGMNMIITCRSIDGKKAWGLDACERFPGARWDSADRKWFAVVSDANHLIRLIADVSKQMRISSGSVLPLLGIENGIKNQTKLDAFFRANSEDVSCI